MLRGCCLSQQLFNMSFRGHYSQSHSTPRLAYLIMSRCHIVQTMILHSDMWCLQRTGKGSFAARLVLHACHCTSLFIFCAPDAQREKKTTYNVGQSGCSYQAGQFWYTLHQKAMQTACITKLSTKLDRTCLYRWIIRHSTYSRNTQLAAKFREVVFLIHGSKRSIAADECTSVCKPFKLECHRGVQICQISRCQAWPCMKHV